MLSPDEHKNFHSERFQSRWYVCGFHDSIFQSCWKMRFFAHPALGMHRRPENPPIRLQGTEPLSESVWHRSRSHHMRDNISAAISVHPAHDKHRHADNSAIYTNFFVQCIHPENRVYCISEGAITELLDLLIQPFVISLTWLPDRFSMPRLCASFSIFRVDTPCTKASCTTCTSIASLRLRSVTKNGM